MSINSPWAPRYKVLFNSASGSQDTPYLMSSNGSFKPLQPGSSSPKPVDLVSVCVPVFNYARFLTECLDSVYHQTYSPLELIIVDDHSESDQSANVAVEWAEKHKSRFFRVVVLSHLRNQGPAETRNTAVRNSLGGWIFPIDADNAIYPRAIERLLSAAVLGFFDGAYAQIEEFGERQDIGDADFWSPAELKKENYIDMMALINVAVWEKVDGFSHIEQGWEDYDFWLKCVDADLRFCFIPQILLRYRVHNESRTATEASLALDTLKAVMASRHPDPKNR